MTARKATPRAPAGLGKPGAAYWRSMHRAYEISARWELDLLELACQQLDDVVQLDAAVEEFGYMVRGSQGQPRMNPAVVEARLSRAAFARIVGQLELPSDRTPVPVPAPPAKSPSAETAASRRGRKAADKRWAKVVHLAPNKEA